MKTTVCAAMFALLVGGSLTATATSFSPNHGVAKIVRSPERGSQYAMRPSDPHFHSRSIGAA